MPPRALIVLIAVLCCGSTRAAAQEAHPPQPTEQGRPTHGIIRKPQPKPPTDATKPTTTSEPGKAEAGKATEHAKPAPTAGASTEAVATAIANAVRTLEEKEKKKAEPAHPQPARNARTAAPRPVPRRRYSVVWPSQRFEVQWAAPDDRVKLSWGAPEATTEYSRGDLRLEP
jgi:hypothetical protein